MDKSLGDIRVLDLSRVLAGPSCTQILGDLGADIVKIERPGAGDDTRCWGPPYLKDKDGNETAESAYYLSANRNKRSVTVDITTPEGQEIIHELLERCDILIENFRTGGLARYGLGYEQVAARHPHIIYTSITGFGQTGPLAREPGYDLLAQAMGGLMSITGAPDGEPMKAGVALSDYVTGLFAAIGTLAALHKRTKTGRGQHVDVALLDCTLASMTNLAQYYLTSGNLPPRRGNAHSTIVPYQAFATRNGHIIVAIGNDRQFARFAAFAEKNWASDERFATNRARVANRETLIPLMQEIIAQETTGWWVTKLEEIGIPVGAVNDMAQVFAHPQVLARDMKIEMNHEPAGRTIDLVGNPLKLSATPVSYDRAPPICGQHTGEVLQELLGMDKGELDRLKAAGVI